MAVGKKVGGLIDQYQNMITSKNEVKQPSLPKNDRALSALQEGGVRDFHKAKKWAVTATNSMSNYQKNC